MTDKDLLSIYWEPFQDELKSWMQPFEMFQKAGNNPFLVYVKSLEVIFTPNPQMQKQMYEILTTMWNPIPITPLFALPYTGEKKLDSTSFDSTKYSNEMWQNPWPTFGLDLFKSYMEFSQKITDFWMKVWKN